MRRPTVGRRVHRHEGSVGRAVPLFSLLTNTTIWEIQVIVENVISLHNVVLLSMFPYCVLCKGGRNLCGRGICPLLERIRHTLKGVESMGDHVSGPSPPEVFIGRFGYPRVGVGPLVPLRTDVDPSTLNRPDRWRGLSVEDVVTMRMSLIRSRHTIDVRSAGSPSRFLELSQEMALSSRPVDAEIVLTGPPKRPFGRFDPFYSPMGPTVEAKEVSILTNPHIPRRVDDLVSDTDAKASDAISELYRSGIDQGHIVRLLSTGLLGKHSRRRLVPTRWAITAVDDTIARFLRRRILDHPEIDAIYCYAYEHFGNAFHVLLIPGDWSFEMCETWLKGAIWTDRMTSISDHEGPVGRKTYAFDVGGAYYAARLSAMEHLNRLGRQASVLIYREIHSQYWAPLGVWVIREGVRQAVRSRPQCFDDLEDALRYVKEAVTNRDWTIRSHLVKDLISQRRITDYLDT